MMSGSPSAWRLNLGYYEIDLAITHLHDLETDILDPLILESECEGWRFVPPSGRGVERRDQSI